jgi:hypothetical protein
MSPEEPLTRFEVWKMIDQEIKTYDAKNDKRHVENTSKLDSVLTQVWEIKQAIATSQGIQSYKQYIAPTILTVGLLIVGIIDLLKHH